MTGPRSHPAPRAHVRGGARRPLFALRRPPGSLHSGDPRAPRRGGLSCDVRSGDPVAGSGPVRPGQDRSGPVGPGMAQPCRHPAGPAVEDARNAQPQLMEITHIVHPARRAAPLVNARTSRSGRAAVACCVIEVARPAHTPTSARDPRSVIACESANWLMRQAIGCSSEICARAYRSGSGSLSQLMSSVENPTGSSSWGK